MGDFLRALFGQQPAGYGTQTGPAQIGMSTPGGPVAVPPGASDTSQAVPYGEGAPPTRPAVNPYYGPQNQYGTGFYPPDPNRPWGSILDIARAIPARAAADVLQLPTGVLEYVLGRAAQPGAEVGSANMTAAQHLAQLYQTEAGRAGLGVPRIAGLAGQQPLGEQQLPPRVYSPQEREQLAAAQEKETENQLYQRWLGGNLQLPAGMQPNQIRVGPMTFGYPQPYAMPEAPGQEPLLEGPGGVSAPPGKGAVEGGNRAQRNNNPGNIKASQYTRSLPGVTGIDPQPAADGGYFLQFDSPQSGFAAISTLLRHGYGRLPADAAMRRWSGGGYGAADVGVDPNQPIGAMSNQQLDELGQRMAAREGYRGAPRQIAAQPAAPPRRIAAATPPAATTPAAPAEAPAPGEEPASPDVLAGPATGLLPPEQPAYPSPAPGAGVQGPPPPAPAPAAPPPAAIATPAPAALPAPAPEAPGVREGTVGYAPPAPEAGVQGEVPPGRVGVPKPATISAKAVDDLRDAASVDPDLKNYLRGHPGLTVEQAMRDPEVRRLRVAYEDRHAEAAAAARAHASAEAKALLKTLPADAGDSVAGYLDVTRLMREISDTFSPEELEQYTGWVNNPTMRTKQAIAAFTQSEIGQALGFAKDPNAVNRRFAAFRGYMGQLKSAMFAIGGKQLTGIEKGVVEQFVPTGTELGGATELVEKGRQFDERARAKIVDIMNSHGVGPEATARILATEAPAAPLFPRFHIAPLEQRGLPGATPGTSTTTTTLPPGAPGGAAAPPAIGGAPPAPGTAPGAPGAPPEPLALRGPPQGGVPASEAGQAGRAYDIALADRLNLAPEYPGETPEETQARRAENVRRAELGQPLVPRKPAEMVAEPGQFGRRLLQTVVDVPNPRKLGQTARAGLGFLGAPGAVVGAGTEAATGSRAAGTAAQAATDIALASGAARRLVSPAVTARQLQALEPEMAAAISRAQQVVQSVPAAPARLTPAAQVVQRQVGRLLDRAAGTIAPGEQSILVNRAVAIARNYLGNRTLPVIEALGDLGATQRQLATSYGTRVALQRGIGRAARYLIPTAVLYNFREAIGRALIQ